MSSPCCEPKKKRSRPGDVDADGVTEEPSSQRARIPYFVTYDDVKLVVKTEVLESMAVHLIADLASMTFEYLSESDFYGHSIHGQVVVSEILSDEQQSVFGAALELNKTSALDFLFLSNGATLFSLCCLYAHIGTMVVKSEVILPAYLTPFILGDKSTGLNYLPSLLKLLLPDGKIFYPNPSAKNNTFALSPAVVGNFNACILDTNARHNLGGADVMCMVDGAHMPFVIRRKNAVRMQWHIPLLLTSEPHELVGEQYGFSFLTRNTCTYNLENLISPAHLDASLFKCETTRPVERQLLQAH